MLKSLTIKNYILIDDLTIDFRSGLSVITGETGAGKSVLVGALNLLCGGRTDVKTVSPKSDKSVIEALFDLSEYGVSDIFSRNDIDYSDECIIRREITAAGKSRAFINDTPINISVLKEVGNYIIDIHSQHQNLLLSDNSFQLDAVDTIAGNNAILSSYRHTYTAFNEKEKQLQHLVEINCKGREEEEYLRFVYNQLNAANLKPEEDLNLEQESLELSHAEETKGALYGSLNLLDEEDGVIHKLRGVLSNLRSVERKSKVDILIQRVESSYIELKDIAGDLSTAGDKIVCDPQRLIQVEERISLLYTLQKRYGKPDTASLIAFKEETGARLATISGGDEEIERLQKEAEHLKKEMLNAAVLLTESRKRGGEKFATELEKQARTLGMPNLRFEVRWERLPDPDYNGAEKALFFFSANKSTALSPVSQSASGGEISRLMLCIKSIIADVQVLPTIFFDEIDTGISGVTAGKVGDIMGDMASSRQVVVITHLPQVAAKGNVHYKVYKEEGEEKTSVYIKELTPKERVSEIAGMISGSVLTEAAMKHAEELLGDKS